MGELKSAQEVYEAWFNHIQTMHAAYPDRHQNQHTYDETLKENYPWVFFNLRRSEIKSVCHDIGCAYGSLSLGAYALGYKVYAVDIVDEYVNKQALIDRDILFIQHDIESGPIPDVPDADVVIFTEVLEHLNCNPIATMHNIRKGMLRGGLLILSTPRKEAGIHTPGVFNAQYDHWSMIPVGRGEWQDAHMYIYSESEIRDLLTRTGFGILGMGGAWRGATTGVLAYAK